MSKKIVANYHVVEQPPKQGGVRGMIDRNEWSKLRRRAKRLEAKQEAQDPQYREHLKMIRALKNDLAHSRLTRPHAALASDGDRRRLPAGGRGYEQE